MGKNHSKFWEYFGKICMILTAIGFVITIANWIINRPYTIHANSSAVVLDSELKNSNIIIAQNVNMNQPEICKQKEICSGVLFEDLQEFGVRNWFMIDVYRNGKVVKTFANYFNITMELPNGQTVFFDELRYNETKTFALCTLNKEFCYIFPQFRPDPSSNHCIKSKWSDWGATKVDFTVYEQRDSCIQEAFTNEFLNKRSFFGE